jgi:hypothetical protein
MTADIFTLYDGAYVLGALSPADRRDYEDHLKTCSLCAGSVAELAGLPGLMSRVSLDQLTEEPEPLPETLLPSLARAVRRRQSRRRLFAGAAAAAAACLIVVGALVVTRPHSPARPPVTSARTSTGSSNLALAAVVPSPISATARLVDMAWGTRIDLMCAYHPKKSSPARALPYALVVINRLGVAEQVSTWTSLPNSKLTVVGASSQARRDIAFVEVQTLDGRTILRLST